MRRAALLLLCLGGCGQGSVYLRSTWSTEHTLVVVTTDDLDAPIGAPQVVGKGQPFELEVPKGQPIRIHVLEFGDEHDLGTCGAVLGGGRLELGLPTKAWASPPALLGEDDAPAFVEVAPEPRAKFDLRYDRCTPAGAECARYRPELTYSSAGPDLSVEQIIAVNESIIFYQADTSTVETARAIRLVRHDFDSTDPQRQIDTGPLTGSIKSFAFDGTHLFGVTQDNQRFRMTTEGELVDYSIVTAPRIAALPGLVLEYGKDGLSAIVGDIPRLDERVGRVALIRPDRIAALTSSAIYYFGGDRWQKEANIRLDAEDWNGIGGDDEVLAAVNASGTVLVRNEAQGRWEDAGTPFNFWKLFQAAGAGGGDLLITGTDGLIGLRVGREFCRIESGVVNGLARACTSPSGRTFFMGGLSIPAVVGDDPPLIRLPIPERP